MDTDAPGSAGPAPEGLTALVRRRRTIVLTGLLGGLAVAVVALAALPSAYTATTAVQIRPPGAAEAGGAPDDTPRRDLDLEAEAKLAGSERTAAVVSETRAEVDLSPTELADRVHVESLPDGGVLEIGYTAPTPGQARDGADAWAEAYLATRTEQTQALLSSHLEALGDEQEVLYTRLARVEGDAARTEALQRDIAELGRIAVSLTAMERTADPGTVVDPANTPASASAPSPLLWLAGGPVVGLASGLAAAFVRDRLDPRVRDGAQAARLSGSPVLMELPVSARLDELLCEPSDRNSPAGQRANACAHLLRSRLSARAPAGGEEEEGPEEADGAKVVLVASVTPGRSGPRAAVDLSAALARTGSETLLVCADPSPAPLGLPEGPGLAEALVDGEDPEALTVRPDSVPRLRVLRHGRPGTSAPVQATVVHDLLELLRPDVEHAVLTSTAGTGRADVEALMGAADALVPVVELGRSRREDLAGLVRAAELTGTAVPGVVVLVHSDTPGVPVPPPPPVPAQAPTPGAGPTHVPTAVPATVPACRVAEHDRTAQDPPDGAGEDPAVLRTNANAHAHGDAVPDARAEAVSDTCAGTGLPPRRDTGARTVEGGRTVPRTDTSGDAAEADAPTETGSDACGEPLARAEARGDTGARTVAGAVTEVNDDTGAGTGTRPDPDAGPDAHAEAGDAPLPRTETWTGQGPTAEAHGEAGARTGTDPDPGAHSGGGTESDADAATGAGR